MNRYAVQLLSKFSLFLMSAVYINSCVAASAADRKIYQVVLDRVTKHEAPPRFAVWQTAIPSSTILSPRLPHHTPENQFISSLHSLPPMLQKRLLGARVDSPVSIAGFDVSAGSAAFVGFVDRATIQKFVEEGARRKELLVIGFSKVAYDQTAGNALVYVESCMTLSEPVCGGEGYWLARIGQSWTIKKQAYLWQGLAQPFWTFKVDAS